MGVGCAKGGGVMNDVSELLENTSECPYCHHHLDCTCTGCARCHGDGIEEDDRGEIYDCSACDGTGVINK